MQSFTERAGSEGHAPQPSGGEQDCNGWGGGTGQWKMRKEGFRERQMSFREQANELLTASIRTFDRYHTNF